MMQYVWWSVNRDEQIANLSGQYYMELFQAR